MKTFSKTDIGMVREVNEDSVFATPNAIGNLPNLFVVADGMGGHNAGDYASNLAVEIVQKSIAENPSIEPETVIREAITTANQKLLEKAKQDVRLKGMGTTLVVATVIDQTLYFANVGDSRLYLLNRGIKQLSKDHSLVQEMLRLGGINREEAKHHPDKNIITRAVGAKQELEIDFFEYRLKKKDCIVMCTDGLSNMVEDEEIFRIVKSSRDIVEVTEQLIEKAKENGGNDNIGVVVVEPFSNEVSV